MRNRNERPEWLDDNYGKTEWVVVDGDIRMFYASDQVEALKKALKSGMRPGNTHDVRPRKGSDREALMPQSRFEEVLDQLLG